MELKDLVGTHMLTAVDMNTDSLPPEIKSDIYGDINVINFELDGITYAVVEDPEDGLRSSMREILVVSYSISNRFAPCEVSCKMGCFYEEVLYMTDVVTNKIVLAVGTETDGERNYYPCFIAEFNPQNMAANTKGK
jgi:hypothetical protein